MTSHEVPSDELSDDELAEVVFKGFDEYWTEDSPGIEQQAWAAAGRAAIKADRGRGAGPVVSAMTDVKINTLLNSFANAVFYREQDEIQKSREALRAALASPRPAGAEPVTSSKARFDEFMQDDPASPLERLRFFCSLAMNGQDWLDVEPFFDALAAPVAAPKVPTCSVCDDRGSVGMPGAPCPFCKTARLGKEYAALQDAKVLPSEASELPPPDCTYADHSYPAYSAKAVREIVAAALRQGEQPT